MRIEYGASFSWRVSQEVLAGRHNICVPVYTRR
jgi:hypothetical protein